MVTIRDVAKRSGFSVTTVSMVVNDSPGAQRISPSTRAHIWNVARKLGYRPNLFARSLRSQRSQSVGVIVFDLTDSYCTQILRGIENHLRRAGYFSVIADLQDDPSEFLRALDMLVGRRVEGVVTIANPDYLTPKLLSEFVDRKIPAVAIGEGLEGSPLGSVSVDNEAAGRLAFQHLYDYGHTRMAFIKGPRMLVDGNLRFRGFETSARDASINLDPRLVVEIKGRNSTYVEGCQLTDELLKSGVDFTALVAFDDLTACAAIRALTKAGKRVPQDCSVVGFDDVPSSAFYNPPLTTVHQLLETQGELGAEMVEDAIQAAIDKRPVVPKCRKVSPKLIVRESTCPVSRI